jgi:hypothetical protein
MWSYAGCVADNGNRVLTGSSRTSVSLPVAISLVSGTESFFGPSAGAGANTRREGKAKDAD